MYGQTNAPENVACAVSPRLRPRRLHQLVDRPLLPRRRIAAHRVRREAIERRIVRRVHRDKLALQMGGQFSEGNAGIGEFPPHLVAIGAAFRGARQIEQPAVPARDLHALIAVPGRPARDGAKFVVRRRVAPELRQEDRRAFDRLHRRFLSGSYRDTVPNVLPRSSWFCRKNATSNTGAR
jgi:hypothetical protein